MDTTSSHSSYDLFIKSRVINIRKTLKFMRYLDLRHNKYISEWNQAGHRGATTAFIAIPNTTTLYDTVLTAEYYTRILCCFRNSACNVWSRWGTSCRTSDHFLVRSWNITTDKDFQNKQTLLHQSLSANSPPHN